MTTKDLILIDTLCLHYKIDLSFFYDLSEIGLVQLQTYNQKQFIHQDKINDIEKMIRLYHDLKVNIEGIDIIFNLLEKEIKLQEELITLKNRLQLYEND